MSMVLTRFPPTMTGSLCRADCWACALCSKPQLQKTIPVAAAAAPAFRKLRRVVMRIASLVCFCGSNLRYTRVGRQDGIWPVSRNLDRSDRLDAGFGDNVAPFRHFVFDALSHAAGAVGDHLEAVVAQLLGDLRRLQNFDRFAR